MQEVMNKLIVSKMSSNANRKIKNTLPKNRLAQKKENALSVKPVQRNKKQTFSSNNSKTEKEQV